MIQSDGVAQKLLLAEWRRNPPVWHDAWLQVYSQNGEDGYLLALLARMRGLPRRALEMCVADGKECCTANLVVNHGWHAGWVEGDEARCKAAWELYSHHPSTYVWPPTCVQAWVDAGNVNEVAEAALEGAPELGVLVIDIDGMDYYVWEALEWCRPAIVCVEYQDLAGPELSVVVPYREDWRVEDWRYTGASLQAMIGLGRRKGYTYVGSEARGYNAFFVADELGPVAQSTVAEAFAPGSKSARMHAAHWPAVADLDWLAV